MPDFWSFLLAGVAMVAIPGVLFLGFAWVTGLFNPQGWLGVPPWRVPPEIRKLRR